MRLRALELDQFRKFDQPVRVRGLADGLNLIVGPNEMGKSTLLAALRAALFEKHRSSARIVQSFQPSRHQTAPRVALDFEIADQSYRIEKRFLKRPGARLALPDGRRIDDEDAEAELERLLAFGPAGRRGADDIWSVLWVAQGQSFALPEVGQGARATLQSCLDAELGQIVGDEQGPAVIAAIEAALYELVDRRGKPRARHREVESELAQLSGEITELERRAAELDQDLARLEDEQRAFERLSVEQAAGEDAAALIAARAQRDGLITLAAQVREAEAAEAIARQTLLQAQKSAAERGDLIGALAALEGQIEQAAAADAEAARQAAASAAAVSWQQGEVERLEAERTQQQRRAAGLRSLRRAIRQADDGRAALDARATEVALSLEPAALDRIRLGGRPAMRTRQTLQAVDPVEIEIEGIGRIDIRPRVAQATRWRRDLAAAERQIASLLHELGLGADAAPDDPSSQLSLFGARSDRPPDLATVEGMAVGTERRAEQLAGQVDGARAELEQRVESHRRQEVALARTKAQVEQARERQAQLRGSLAEAEASTAQAELGAAVSAGAKALELAGAELARLRQGDPAAPLAAVEARIARLEQTIERRRSRLGDLRGSVQGLQARVQLHAGEGLAERLDWARRRLGELEREHAKCRREVQVLQLLRTTLSEAEREAKERYLAPVVGRIRPYLQALFPDAEIALDETLRITAVKRGQAGDEPFERLSEGTREQIAILVRLALAELMHDQGLPAVVVLDDALVFSDDERMQRMFAILERAAATLQIIVLTCRERLFEGLAGKRLHLELCAPAPEARGAA